MSLSYSILILYFYVLGVNKNITVNNTQSTSENGKSPANTVSLRQVQQAMQEVTKAF